MPDPNSTSAVEELGYFYDTIHGRVALEELPEKFHPALKSALSAKSLDRLRRISQLGHTSISFFSATHTRFSHAIGTMLVMNKLFRHVNKNGLAQTVFDEVKQHYAPAVAAFGGERKMVHCHLLLAALYQDVGELPFQKVTSLYFSPVENDIKRLVNAFPNAKPRQWSGKKVFSLLSLLSDFSNAEIGSGFADYDREFLAYLMTGDGTPAGAQAMPALLELIDGVIDADRLDYVYRDASVTIGSLSRPNTVLESIVGYEPGRVIVNDPRPASDFLSTRMRLWTFVYSSADVRFRQTLLKAVLDGRWDRPATTEAFKKCDLEPELPHQRFMELDDYSLMDRIGRLDPANLEPYRQQASKLLVRGTLDYECRALKRGQTNPNPPNANDELPTELFFDLLLDHGHHQLYRPESVWVRQLLTSRIADTVRLEESSGAFSALFSGENSAILVPKGYYAFLPRQRQGGRWPTVEQAIATGSLYSLAAWEDARRGIPPTDTRSKTGFPDFGNERAVSISYCSKDLPTVVRIVRQLHKRKRRYRLFLRPFDGTGGTPAGNSDELVKDAEAVIAVVSTDYLQRALDETTYVGIEVKAMRPLAKDIPVVAFGVDDRHRLKTVPGWDWGRMNEDWQGQDVVIPNDLSLRNASEEILRSALDEGLKSVDQWAKHP